MPKRLSIMVVTVIAVANILSGAVSLASRGWSAPAMLTATFDGKQAVAARSSKLSGELQRLCLDGQPANLNETSCRVSGIRRSTVSSRYLMFTGEPQSRTVPGQRTQRFIAGERNGRWSVVWQLDRHNGRTVVFTGPIGAPYNGPGVECPPQRVLSAWHISQAECDAYISKMAALLMVTTRGATRSASAALDASSSHSCPAFRAVLHSESQGRRWTFDDRMYGITAQGVSCTTAHRTILQADGALNREEPGPGVFIGVNGWRCRAYRPVDEGGISHWGSLCERGGNRQVSWGEQTLHAREASAMSVSRLRAAHGPSGERRKTAHIAGARVYFYEAVGISARPRVRPTRIIFSADGNNMVTGLHWTGWGSATARSVGIDHVNNCQPDCAQGHVSKVRAQVRLSRPGLVDGLHIYRCYSVSPSIKGYQMLGCLPNTGSGANAAAAHSLPKLPTDGGWEAEGHEPWLEVRPAVVSFTGDGTAYLGGFTGRSVCRDCRSMGRLTWHEWTDTGARAVGAIWGIAMNRNGGYIRGSYVPHAVSVHAFMPISGVFTRLTYSFSENGRRVTYGIHAGRCPNPSVPWSWVCTG